jgi:predicted porin
MYRFCVVVLLAGVSDLAYADSGVELSGMIDGGVTYVSNEQGHSATFFDSGIAAPSTLSIRGREDLGNGVRTLFVLTSQFNIGDGATVPSAGAIFSRTALLGLESDRYGRLTLGTQYDFMTDSLTFKDFDNAFSYSGLYDYRQGPFAKLAIPGNPTGAFDFDRMAGSESVPNSIKYQSPEYYGLSAGGLYGFGGMAGSTSVDTTTSFGVNYERGPFAMGLAYVDVKYPELADGHEGIRNWGSGMHYQFSRVLATLLFTRTQNTLTGAAVDVYKVGASGTLTGAWSGAVDYTYMKGNEAVGGAAANQVAATISYAFSARTRLYAEAIFQRTNSSSDGAWINGLPQADGESSGQSQFLSRIGVRTIF